MSTQDMTYSESARGVRIGEARAVREMQDHGIYDSEAQREGLTYSRVSDNVYSASKLLAWLGY